MTTLELSNRGAALVGSRWMRIGFEEQPLQQDTRLSTEEREPRYDRETLQRVTALAQRLQDRQGDTLTAAEIEAIGAEVGLERSFIRQALGLVTEKAAATTRAVSNAVASAPSRQLKAFHSAWWAAGWTLPLILLGLPGGMAGGNGTPVSFFLGWAIYLGGGIFLSHMVQEPEKEGGRHRSRTRRNSAGEAMVTPPAPAATAPVETPVARSVLLERLFALQHQLETQKRHYAFLSLDVVGSTEMKVEADALAVEYSFGQFRTWTEGVVRACGGEMQSTAGDGMMAVFGEDAGALRAARRIQAELAAFNAGINRLSRPFAVRCGVSAGEVALEPGIPLGHINSAVVDRAAALQKRGLPGDVVVSAELAAAALVELGGLAPLPEEVLGQPAFSWLAARKTA